MDARSCHLQPYVLYIPKCKKMPKGTKTEQRTNGNRFTATTYHEQNVVRYKDVATYANLNSNLQY